MFRRVVVLPAALGLACASQPATPPPAPAPAPIATRSHALTSSTAAAPAPSKSSEATLVAKDKPATGSTPASRAEAKIKPASEAPKPTVEEQIAAVRAVFAEAQTSLSTALTAVADKKVTSDQIERARAELARQEKALAEAAVLEKHDGELGMQAVDVKVIVDKGKEILEARWREVGAALQKPALENALRVATQAVANAKQKTASADVVAKAEAAVKALQPIIDRGVQFELTDAKYGTYATTVKPQVPQLEAGVGEARAALAVRQQRDALTKAKAAAEATLVALRKTVEEAAFEATASAMEGVDASLATGQGTEAKDAEYGKLATAARAWVETTKTEIAGHRVRQKIEAHKVLVEAARKAATEAAKVLPATHDKATDAAPVEASEKATVALEAALAPGKEWIATDKKYAEYAALVTKELEARRASAVLARQALAIKAERARIEAAQAELDARAGVYKTTPSPDALSAAEKAAGELEKVLAGSAELAGKDKVHAALVAAHTKKLADARAMLLGTKNEQAIAAHKAELAAAKTAVMEALAGLKGKLEYDAYAAAAKVVEAMGRVITAGEPLGATNAKYAAELTTAKGSIVGFEMQARRTWIEAADAAVKARLEALAGQPEPVAFTDAEKAVKTLATTAESSKAASFTDKAYLAFVAAAEKQAVAYKAQIEQRRVSLRVDTLKASVETVAAAAAEAMKGLEGEPASAAFDKAESAVKDWERALEPDTELATSQPAYVAEQKKKVAAARTTIAERRVQVVVGGHRKTLGEATSALAAALKTLAGAATDENAAAAESAVSALEKVLASGGPAVEVQAKYGAELATAKGRVEPARAEIAKRKNDAAVAAHKAEVDAAAAELATSMQAIAGPKPEPAAFEAAEKSAEALEGVIEEGEAVAAKDAKHAALLTAAKKKLDDQRAAIARGKVGLEVAGHRALVEAEKAKVTAALTELAGKTEEAPYQAAEKAIGALASVLSSGEAVAEKDAKYAGELKAKVGEIPGLRMQIQRRRIEAAATAATERTKVLDGKEAFEAAGDAIEKLTDAIEKARGFKTEDKAYAATLAASDKQVAALTAAVEKKKVDGEVAAHRERLKAAVDELKGASAALAQSPESAGAAGDKANAVEKVIADGKSVATKSPPYDKELLAATKEVEKARAAIASAKVSAEIAEHKKKVEAATAEVIAKLGGLGKLEYELFAGAETAVAALEKALSSGEDLAESRPAYGKELAAARAKVEGYRITIRNKWIESAEAVVLEKIKALEGTPADKAFKAADDAVIVLARTVESGRTLTQQAAYQKALAAADKRATDYRAKIDQRRVDIVVDVHRNELDAAEKALAEAMAGLAGKPEDKAFKAAEAAVAELLSTVESGANAGEKDPAYGKRLAALNTKVPGMRGAIEARRVEVEIQTHRESLDVATKKVADELAALAKGTAFTGAEQAIQELENVIEGGKSAGDKSPAYAKVLAAEEKKIDDHKARVARRRSDLAVAEHAASLDAAQAAMVEAMKGLSGVPEAAALTAAEEAVGELESELSEGAELGKASPGHAKKLAALKADVPKRRAAIGAAKVNVEVAGHKKAIAEATGEAEQKVAALAEGVSGSAVKAAEKAVAALEKTVETVPELAKKNAAHAKGLGAFGKKVAELRAAIARREAETEIKKHRQEVETAVEEVASRLAALGKLEYDLFASAETGVAKLEKVLAGGEGLGEKDPTYKKDLAAVQSRVEGYRITIRQKWIEAANAVVLEKLGALDTKADDRAFKGAEDAVVVLDRTIESGQSLTKAPAYQKQLAASAKLSAGYRTRIDKKRVSLVVDAHKAELESAEKTLAEAMEATQAPKPEDAAFKAAGAAVKELEDTIDSGTDAAAKDPAYGKRLAALKGKIGPYRAAIEKRRFEADVSGNKEKIAGALKAVNGALGALAGEPEDAAFDAAESAVGDLESALADGKPFGAENKAYAAALAAEQKKLPGFRARIAKRRSEVEVAAAVAELTEVQSALAAKMKSLGDEASFTAAEEAIGAVESQVGEGAALAKSSPAYAKRLAAAKAELPKRRAAIASAKVGLEVAAHKKVVETAAAEAAQRIEQLDDGVTPSSMKAAEGAIETLEEATGSELARKSPAHAKWLAAYAKKVPALKKAVARKSIEKELEAHRREIQEAHAEVQERMGALDKLEYELFAAAESAVNALEKVIAGGESLGEQDPAYAKALKAASAKIIGFRIDIRKKWIDEARSVAQEKLAATEGKADEKAFKAAEDAVKVLNNTIESGQSLSKAAPYQKMLAAAEKQAAGFYATIDRRRAQSQFAEVRGELDDAVAAASAAMAKASDEPDAASSALGALADAIDSNAGAADRDPAHKKRLGLLRKKLAADRAKVAKLVASSKTKAELAAVTEAEQTLAEAVATLKRQPDDAAVQGVEEAIEGVESAMEGKEPTGKAKAYYAGLKRKVAAARLAMVKSRGDALVREHKSQLAAQLVSARVAMGGLKKMADREAIAAATSAVDGLVELVDSGKELAKANKKYGAFLAAARKTSAQYKTTLRKTRVAPAVEEASASAEAPEAEEEEGEDPKAKLEAAQVTARKLLKVASAKGADESAVSSAKVALDDLADSIEGARPAAKKNKALGKKIALAKIQLSKGRKAIAKIESVAAAKAARLAKIEAAKAAKAERAAAAAAGDDEDGDAPQGDAVASPEEAKARVASAWTAMAKLTKAMKGKKPSLEQVDAALEAVGEVEAALAENVAVKSPKYVKYAAGIKKKLKLEKGKLTKRRRALEASRS